MLQITKITHIIGMYYTQSVGTNMNSLILD